MRGLSKDPDARWDSCASFVAALEMALDPATRSTIEQTIAFAPPIPAVSAEPTPQFRPITPTVRQPATRSIAATTVVEGAAFRGPDASIAENPPVITREGAVIRKGTPKQRRTRRRALYVSVGAIALILLLLLGTAAYFDITSPTTLSISKNPAVPGDVVTITAAHVPRDQAGVIELHSLLHTYPFRSDGNGNVTGVVTLPDNIEVGAHRLLICWGGTCHKELILQIVDGVAFLPSPGSSSSPSTAPGSTPVAWSTPTATARPTSSPTSAPKSSPSPSRPPASITLTSISLLNGVKLTFNNFPAGSVQIYVFQGSNRFTAKTVSVPSNAPTWSTTVPTPSGVAITLVAVAPPAYVAVCHNPCLSSGPVNVTA